MSLRLFRSVEGGADPPTRKLAIVTPGGTVPSTAREPGDGTAPDPLVRGLARLVWVGARICGAGGTWSW